MGEGTNEGTRNGWRAPTRRLEWPTGHFMHGLWVDVRLVSIGEYRRLAEEWDDVESATLRKEQLPEGEGLEDVLRQQLGRVVVAWNYEDEDGPVPSPRTLEDFDRVAPEVLTAVRHAWFESVGKPPAPLSVPSNDSGRSADVEELLPMDSL